MSGSALNENVGFPSAGGGQTAVFGACTCHPRTPVYSLQHLRISWRHAKNTWQEVEVNLTRKNIDNRKEGSDRFGGNQVVAVMWSLLSLDHEYEYMREVAEWEVVIVNGSLLDWWGERGRTSSEETKNVTRVTLVPPSRIFSLVALKQQPLLCLSSSITEIHSTVDWIFHRKSLRSRQPGLPGKQVPNLLQQVFYNASCLVANVFMEYVEGVTFSQYLEPIQSGFGASWICLTAPKG